MPPISWLKIRKWNGTQQDAFEQVCCQLAHAEPVPPGTTFISKGKPDSGVECYVILPTGDEWGWQAKFFPNGLTYKRWEQCDDSAKKALAGHPRLTKLFFCIPRNFPDSRLPNTTTALDQWNSRRHLPRRQAFTRLTAALGSNAFARTQEHATAGVGNTNARQPLKGFAWLRREFEMALSRHGRLPKADLARLDWPAPAKP